MRRADLLAGVVAVLVMVGGCGSVPPAGSVPVAAPSAEAAVSPSDR